MPALVATAVSQLLMGSASVSRYQLPRRVDPLTRRLASSITSAMTPQRLVCPATTTLDELSPLLAADELGLALVVDGDEYIGTVSARELLVTPRGEWATTHAASVAVRGQATARTDWTLAQARAALAAGSAEAVVVVDESGQPIGVVTTDSIADQLGDDEAT